MIVIIDYGLGNLGSIKNMIRKIGRSAIISSDQNDIKNASVLVLPGVGAFDTGIQHLRSSGLIDLLNERVLTEKTPVLGICLGAQLMTLSSEEGKEPGLGWFDAETVRMNFSELPGKWPLPNIGWRDVHVQNSYELLSGYSEIPRFYFVHSYHMRPNDHSIVSMTSTYGFEFSCGLSKDNIHCVQFHPEKSHSFGMRFFRNFMEAYS